MGKFRTNIFDINYFELLMSRQRLDVILENKVLKKLKFSKNANNKKCAPKMILFKGKKWERFGYFLTWKIDVKSYNFAIFDDSEVVQSSWYQKIIGAEFTHWYMPWLC